VRGLTWPTPRTSENENRQTKATPSQLAGEHGWSLGAAVNHQWPTPTTTEGKGPTRGAKAQGGMGLSETVRTWLSPTVEDAGRMGSPEWAARWASGEAIPETQQRLRTQVLATWSTPMASDYKSRGGSAGWEGSDIVSAAATTFDPVRNVALNPAWVCRLMGFPDGWTIISGPPVVAKLSTPASPRARRRV